MTTARLLAAGVVLAAVALLGPLAHPFGAVREGADSESVLFDGMDVPVEVMHTFEQKCADCHSKRTRWPWYTHVAPASWLLERDVAAARQKLDASEWRSYDAEQRIDLLSRLAKEARRRSMPPPQYTLVHRDAKLTETEAAQISTWAKAERAREQVERR